MAADVTNYTLLYHDSSSAFPGNPKMNPNWALSCSIRDDTTFHDLSLNAQGLAVNQLITHAQPVSRTYGANRTIVR